MALYSCRLWLGPTLYQLYTTDFPLPTQCGPEIAIFADDIAILSTSVTHTATVDNLQETTNSFITRANNWKLAINDMKSTRVDFALGKHDYNPILYGCCIAKSSSAKYLGLHLDERLRYSTDISSRQAELKLRIRKLNWLLNCQSSLSLANKRLNCVAILKPIWCYIIQMGLCYKKSMWTHRTHFKIKFSGWLQAPPFYICNNQLHSSINLPTVEEEVQLYVLKHVQRLHPHPNTVALQRTHIVSNVITR